MCTILCASDRKRQSNHGIVARKQSTSEAHIRMTDKWHRSHGQIAESSGGTQPKEVVDR